MYCEPYLVYLIEDGVCRIMDTACVNVCFSEIWCRRKMCSVTSSEAILGLALKHNVNLAKYIVYTTELVSELLNTLLSLSTGSNIQPIHCYSSCIPLQATSFFPCECACEVDKSGWGKVKLGNLNCLLIDGCCHPIPLALFLHTLVVANLISALIECNLVKKSPLLIFPVSFSATDGQRNFHYRKKLRRQGGP